MAGRKWTDEEKAEASRKAKERAAEGGFSVSDDVEALKAENERLKAEIARNQLGMTVQREELPPTPKQFLDDENWHYYLCIQSKGDEEDELADKLSRDPLKGGYEIAPGGKISSRKTWLRIPQTLFKSRKQAAVDEARARWQRPEGQDVRDGLIQKREQSEQYVGAGLPAGVA